MKSILKKTVLILIICIINNLKSQSYAYNEITETIYSNFYNQIVPKLNQIVPIKTQFYTHNFGSFCTFLQNNNIEIIEAYYDSKFWGQHPKHILDIYFYNMNMRSFGVDNKFQLPWVRIYFTEPIPENILNQSENYRFKWNAILQTAYSPLIIEKIEFLGLTGYNNPDRIIQ